MGGSDSLHKHDDDEDERAGTAAARPKRGSHGAPKRKPEEPALDWRIAQWVVDVAGDVVRGASSRIEKAPADFAPALRLLRGATQQHKAPKEREAMLELAMIGLAPAIEASRETDAEWLDERLLKRVGWLRDGLGFERARQRVDQSVRIGPDEVIEIPDDGDPHAQGHVLHGAIQKLIPAIEQVVRIEHDRIHHGADALMDGHGKDHGAKAGKLTELVSMLGAVDGYLILGDEEFHHHLKEVHGIFNGVATYTELVKAVVELTGGAVQLMCSSISTIAKLAGDDAMAAAATGASQTFGLGLANVVAGVELVHGLATVFDASASRQARIDGGVTAASSAAWLVGKSMADGAGAAASGAITLGYQELKWALGEFWATSRGVAGRQLQGAYQMLADDGAAIASAADLLGKAGALLAEEQDPGERAALSRVEQLYATETGRAVDGLLSDCVARDLEGDGAKYPGQFGILRELFAPVKAHKHAATPKAAAAAAALALDRIAWAMNHSNEIVDAAAAGGESLAEVERAVAANEGSAGGHH